MVNASIRGMRGLTPVAPKADEAAKPAPPASRLVNLFTPPSESADAQKESAAPAAQPPSDVGSALFDIGFDFNDTFAELDRQLMDVKGTLRIKSH